LTQRAKDSVINGQIRSLLIQAKDVHSSAVYIVVERGIVYLMGRLTEQEAKRVTDLVSTSQVSGLEKVVRVFELLSEEDLRRLSAPAKR
jgi:osmotically-inducible protein OsmY